MLPSNVAALVPSLWHCSIILLSVLTMLHAGITLSPNQVKRGTELAQERGLTNVKFQARTSAQGLRVQSNRHREELLYCVGPKLMAV